MAEVARDLKSLVGDRCEKCQDWKQAGHRGHFWNSTYGKVQTGYAAVAG